MIRSLWIAKTGLDTQQMNIDTIANNLANISTNGYKRQRPLFEDLLYQNLRQSGAQNTQQNQIPSGLQIGTGARTVATERIFTQGNLQRTDNSLDLAINGNGFFSVLMPDGTTGYTRDGAFQKDANGVMVTSNGYPVQPQITIPPDTISLTIGSDGTVSITQAGSPTPSQIGTLQLSSFINPAGLESIGENLMLETASSGAPNIGTPGTNGLGLLNQSYVETSNVNVAEELVSMIQAQRAFELNSKAVTASDQMLQKLTQL